MIFVALGNSPCQFIRLAMAVDNLPVLLGDEVIVQSGYTNFDFKNAKATRFLTHEQFVGNLKRCNTAILQGGWGGSGGISVGL